MYTKTLLSLAAALVAVGASAQASAPVNSHKVHDAKLRDCRKQAVDQQIKEEERRAFVAACMKKKD